MSLSWKQDNDYIITPNDGLNVSTTKMPPVFPDETLAVMSIDVILKGENITENLLEGEMIKTLYHSTGSETITNSFHHIFRDTLLKNKLITEDDKYIFKTRAYVTPTAKPPSKHTY